MTYPQPLPSTAVGGGQNFFRFNTKVNGPGEIYEIDCSVKALAMGPDCDFAQLQVSYFDTAQTGSLLNNVRITPGTPFPAGLTSRTEQNYPLSPTRKGRMLVSLIDVMTPIPTVARADDGWRPAGFNSGVDEILFVPPVIDLIGWFIDPPPVPIARADRQYLFQNTPKLNPGTYWLVVPTYGRKYIFVDFFNHSGANVDVGILGLNYATCRNLKTSVVTDVQEQTTLLAVATIADGAKAKKIATATSDGMFDAIAISYAVAGALVNTATRIRLSDTST